MKQFQFELDDEMARNNVSLLTIAQKRSAEKRLLHLLRRCARVFFHVNRNIIVAYNKQHSNEYKRTI